MQNSKPESYTPRFVRVEAPHFVAGLVLNAHRSRCVEAAPILRWAIGKHINELASYFKRKGWKATGMPVEILTVSDTPEPTDEAKIVQRY